MGYNKFKLIEKYTFISIILLSTLSFYKLSMYF